MESLYSQIIFNQTKNGKVFRNNDIIANPIISNNKMYIVSHSGTLASYDLKKSAFMVSTNWRREYSNFIRNSLFLIDNNNILYAINKNNGKIKWIKQFDLNIEDGFILRILKKLILKDLF